MKREVGRIILIRHGETKWNAEGRSQGWADNGLNESGLEQAALVGDFIRSKFGNARVISSDLMRCTQTADALGLDYSTHPLIREIDTGKFSGLLGAEIEARYPEAAKSLSYSLDSTEHGGESWRQVIIRVKRFVAEERIFDNKVNVVIVSHGGTIKCLIAALLGLPDESIDKFHMDNTGVTVVRHEGSPDTAALELHNSTQHLDQPGLA